MDTLERLVDEMLAARDKLKALTQGGDPLTKELNTAYLLFYNARNDKAAQGILIETWEKWKKAHDNG